MVDFLIDENMSRSVVFDPVDMGHRARHVADVGLRGAPDQLVFDRAQNEGWIIVTRDVGFGNLLSYPLGTHVGIVLLRLPSTFTAGQIRTVLASFISDIDVGQLSRALTIVEPARYRIRRARPV